MGYPMTYPRVVIRNRLTGEYGDFKEYNTSDHTRAMIGGDLRRLESDTQDDHHIKWYAEESGATEEQVRKIFELFFNKGNWTDWRPAKDRAWRSDADGSEWTADGKMVKPPREEK